MGYEYMRLCPCLQDIVDELLLLIVISLDTAETITRH
jgi:hypothetical protein